MVNIPEHRRIKVNKILGRQIRVVDTQNRPAKVFVEVLDKGVVVQSGFTDILGLLKVGKGNRIRVWDEQTEIIVEM
jgi:hypothetical protein